jgi:hypothetical protein
MWIHHWVVLQFLHPAFEVSGDLCEMNDKGRFKYFNRADFICVIAADIHNENQKHRLEWRYSEGQQIVGEFCTLLVQFIVYQIVNCILDSYNFYISFFTISIQGVGGICQWLC